MELKVIVYVIKWLTLFSWVSRWTTTLNRSWLTSLWNTVSSPPPQEMTFQPLISSTWCSRRLSGQGETWQGNEVITHSVPRCWLYWVGCTVGLPMLPLVVLPLNRVPITSLVVDQYQCFTDCVWLCSAATWGLKRLRESSSTSSVCWNSTRESFHSLLLRSATPSGTRSHLAQDSSVSGEF